MKEQEEKMEHIFEMPSYKGVEYRIRSKFGHSIITFSWWNFLEKKITIKPFIFFGPAKEIWIEVDREWYSSKIRDIQHLKEHGEELYRDNVLLHDKLIEEARSLKMNECSDEQKTFTFTTDELKLMLEKYTSRIIENVELCNDPDGNVVLCKDSAADELNEFIKEENYG